MVRFTISLVLFFSFNLITAQISWAPYTGNPVIGEGFAGSSDVFYSPMVLSDSGTYHMWFTTKQGSTSERIAYATSLDGMNWALVDSTVLEPSSNPNRFDSQKLGQCWVIKENDTLRMWYWGDGPNIGNIGYAWSLDGIIWNKTDGSGTDQSIFDRNMDGSGALAVSTPCVLKDGATYHMWYVRTHVVGVQVIRTLAHATSPNGIDWTNIPGPGPNGTIMSMGSPGDFDEGTQAFPVVIKKGNEYWMWYSGGNAAGNIRIGFAKSTDGQTWTKIPGIAGNGAVLSNMPDQILGGTVLDEETTLKMYYSINNQPDILLAVSEIISSVESTSETKPEIYPNPFGNQLMIRFSTGESVTFSLYSFLGQQVLQQTFTNSTHIHTEQLVNGIYFYELKNDKGVSKTGIVVKQ